MPEPSLSSSQFACLDNMCVLVIETSLVQLAVVYIESSTDFSDGALVASLDISRCNMLRRLPFRLHVDRVKQT